MPERIQELEARPAKDSHNHIPDPLDEKIRFLKLCKERLPRGGKLCIADVFIPEAIHKAELDSLLDSMWATRRLEVYSSVF